MTADKIIAAEHEHMRIRRHRNPPPRAHRLVLAVGEWPAWITDAPEGRVAIVEDRDDG